MLSNFKQETACFVCLVFVKIPRIPIDVLVYECWIIILKLLFQSIGCKASIYISQIVTSKLIEVSLPSPMLTMETHQSPTFHKSSNTRNSGNNTLLINVKIMITDFNNDERIEAI